MPKESTMLPLDDSIEEGKRSGRPEYEHEMPPIPKPSIAYRFSQMTSLGKRKRTAQERTTPEAPSHLSTSLPGYDSVTSEETPIVGDILDTSQYQSRRRHSSIVGHVSKKLKESWRWLNRDSVRTPDSIDVLLQRASDERYKACPGVNDERGRYEGRANIPRVTSYLDLRTVGPSNFYDTPDYRRFQSRLASDSQESDPSSAQSDPEGVLTSSTSSNTGIFWVIRKFSQPSQDGPGPQAHFRPVSWSPKKLFNRSRAKRCVKQPVRSPNSQSQTNVPAAPDNISAIPITGNFNQRHTTVNTEPVYEIDSNLRWSSSEGSSNEWETSFEIRPLDGEPLRPYLDHCVRGRLEMDEHVLPTLEHDADGPRFDTTVSSRPLLEASLHQPRPDSLSVLRTNTGEGLAPDSPHPISRSTSDYQMTLSTSPRTSRHGLDGLSQPTNNGPDLAFDMTHRQSLQVRDRSHVLVIGTSTDEVDPSMNGVALDHLNNQRIRIVPRSPSPPTSGQPEAEVDDSTHSSVVDLPSPLDGPSRNSRTIRAAETRAWWEKE